MMSSTKPEVQSVSQRNRRSTKQHAQKLIKTTRVVLEIFSRTYRHTGRQDTHTQSYLSQYFATAPAGEVIYNSKQYKTGTEIPARNFNGHKLILHLICNLKQKREINVSELSSLRKRKNMLANKQGVALAGRTTTGPQCSVAVEL